MKLVPLTLAWLVCLCAQTPAARLAERARGATPLASDLSELCDGIGGRPTGSDACALAVKWAAAKFRAAGIANVKIEPYTVPNLWLGETAEARITAPAAFAVRIAAAPFSASTRGVLDAAVLDSGEGDVEKLGTRARGAIILVRSRETKTFDDLFAEYERDARLLEAAYRFGAAALLIESSRARGLLYRHPVNLNAQIEKIPAALVAREHAERIARLAARGPVRMRLRLTNRIAGPYTAHNVVAEIPGRDLANEIVLAGAHLDSWDLGNGAEDNGVNVAMVIDLARGFAQLGIRPRRTIRFVLFTGEEQGMWGSAGYVDAHRGELSRHRVAAIFDTGSGRLNGFYLNGREDLRAPVADALAAVADLGVDRNIVDALDGTDNFDFMLSGVPNLVAYQEMAAYLPDYHAESDVVERSNLEEQRRTEAAAAALLYGLAEADRLPSRQTREQVDELLARTRVERPMRLFGQWNDWKSGRRGRFE